MPLEVSPTHPILSSFAQKDLAIIKEIFDSRNDEENVDNASFTPYVSKSHKKKMKSKTGNIKYNIRYKGEHINITHQVSLLEH